MHYEGILIGVLTFVIIGLLFAQEKRVKMGWFPKNPNRDDNQEN